jgi:hypothetical protein
MSNAMGMGVFFHVRLPRTQNYALHFQQLLNQSSENDLKYHNKSDRKRIYTYWSFDKISKKFAFSTKNSPKRSSFMLFFLFLFVF